MWFIGFTRLNETLGARWGKSGGEKVTLHLNRYFTLLLNTIQKHGGDTIKFAGDALIVLFSPESTGDKSKPAEIGAIEATMRALQCGLELQAKCGIYRANTVETKENKKKKHISSFSSASSKLSQASNKKVNPDDVVLTLHIAISSGDVYMMRVGNVNNEWEYLLVGEPFKELGDALTVSKSGDVVLARNTYALVQNRCTRAPDHKITEQHDSKTKARKKKKKGHTITTGHVRIAAILPKFNIPVCPLRVYPPAQFSKAMICALRLSLSHT